MKNTKKNTSRSKINYAVIEPAERIRILWKCIEKGGSQYDFYDIQYGEVIIKGVSIVEGKNGDFLGMPSQERAGSYYPVVFLTHSLSDRILEYINDADENDTWEDTDETYLSFEEINENSDNGKSGNASRKRNRNND